jgi:hypothetical protein
MRNPRGRPKGSYKLPPEYLGDLVRLLDLEFPPPRSADGWDWTFDPARIHHDINKKCRITIARSAKDGGVKWLRKGVVVARITNPKILRTRIHEALKRWRNPTKRLTMTPTYTVSHPVAGPETAERSSTEMTGRWNCRQTVLMVGKKLHK